jgi:hypothetical protein
MSHAPRNRIFGEGSTTWSLPGLRMPPAATTPEVVSFSRIGRCVQHQTCPILVASKRLHRVSRHRTRIVRRSIRAGSTIQQH